MPPGDDELLARLLARRSAGALKPKDRFEIPALPMPCLDAFERKVGRFDRREPPSVSNFDLLTASGIVSTR